MYIPTEEKKITDAEFVSKFTESSSWRLADVLAWRANEESVNHTIMALSHAGMVVHYLVALDINGHRWYFDGSGVYSTTAPILQRYDLTLDVTEFKWADRSTAWTRLDMLLRTDIDEDNGGSAEQYYLQSNFYLDEYFNLLGMGE